MEETDGQPPENFIDALTPAEMLEHFGETPSAEEIRGARELCAREPDYNFQHLFLLYLDRGETGTAQAYLDRIKDPQRKLDAAMLAWECRG